MLVSVKSSCPFQTRLPLKAGNTIKEQITVKNNPMDSNKPMLAIPLCEVNDKLEKLHKGRYRAKNNAPRCTALQ